MVSTVDVTAAQAGVNFFAVPDNTRIHRGDVVAVVIGSGQLRFRSVASSCFEVSSTNAVAASMTCVDGEHQFRAHLVQVKNTLMRFGALWGALLFESCHNVAADCGVHHALVRYS